MVLVFIDSDNDIFLRTNWSNLTYLLDSYWLISSHLSQKIECSKRFFESKFNQIKDQKVRKWILEEAKM